jgi:hypothetical protein
VAIVKSGKQAVTINKRITRATRISTNVKPDWYFSAVIFLFMYNSSNKLMGKRSQSQTYN